MFIHISGHQSWSYHVQQNNLHFFPNLPKKNYDQGLVESVGLEKNSKIINPGSDQSPPWPLNHEGPHPLIPGTLPRITNPPLSWAAQFHCLTSLSTEKFFPERWAVMQGWIGGTRRYFFPEIPGAGDKPTSLDMQDWARRGFPMGGS